MYTITWAWYHNLKSKVKLTMGKINITISKVNLT
jgi:hypothetical protein